MKVEILVPVLMSCAMLWWLGRSMSWTRRLTVAAVTLAIVILIVWFDNARP